MEGGFFVFRGIGRKRRDWFRGCGERGKTEGVDRVRAELSSRHADIAASVATRNFLIGVAKETLTWDARSWDRSSSGLRRRSF